MCSPPSPGSLKIERTTRKSYQLATLQSCHDTIQFRREDVGPQFQPSVKKLTESTSLKPINSPATQHLCSLRASNFSWQHSESPRTVDLYALFLV